MKHLHCLLLASLSLSAICHSASAKPADIEVAFSPDQGATLAIVKFIGEAKKSIRVAAYSFTSPQIAHALVMAHNRGVDTAVVLDSSNETARYSAATYLSNDEVPLRINHKYKIMHNKFIIVDGVSVETGSFNFTKAAEQNNAENLLIIRDKPDIAKAYSDNWKRLWDESDDYKRDKN